MPDISFGSPRTRKDGRIVSSTTVITSTVVSALEPLISPSRSNPALRVSSPGDSVLIEKPKLPSAAVMARWLSAPWDISKTTDLPGTGCPKMVSNRPVSSKSSKIAGSVSTPISSRVGILTWDWVEA